MRYYTWDNEKNKKLIAERQISFEEIVLYIGKEGYLLDTVTHPNQEKYKGQRVFVVRAGGYVYLVPFEEKEDTVFLKTIIPSRKATKKYLKEDTNNEAE